MVFNQFTLVKLNLFLLLKTSSMHWITITKLTLQYGTFAKQHLILWPIIVFLSFIVHAHRSKAYVWLTAWLMERIRCVVLDSYSSNHVKVEPQETVLGLLIYINDISVGISSSPRLFADDCVLYRITESYQNQYYLQSYLMISA